VSRYFYPLWLLPPGFIGMSQNTALFFLITGFFRAIHSIFFRLTLEFTRLRVGKTL
jgi:hypothetical protein